MLWGAALPKYTTQGSAMTVPLSVYAPADGTAELTLTVTGPAEDPLTTESEALAAGDLKVYGSSGTDMVAMPLTLDLATGQIVGTWNATLTAGYTPVTWYATVAEGAPVGSYAFGVALTGGNTLDPISVVVFAPETHGEQPPDSGEDTTAPVLTVTPDDRHRVHRDVHPHGEREPRGLRLHADDERNGRAVGGLHVARDLQRPGAWRLRLLRQATDKALNASEVVTRSWTVEPPDTTPPAVAIDSAVVAGATATFEFSSVEPGVTFECMLTKDDVDGAPEAACTSPKEYTDLAPGTYTFSVVGIDEAGNRSDPVVSDPWTVIAPPDTTRSGRHHRPGRRRRVPRRAVTFTADEPNVDLRVPAREGHARSARPGRPAPRPSAYTEASRRRRTRAQRARDRRGREHLGPVCQYTSVVDEGQGLRK